MIRLLTSIFGGGLAGQIRAAYEAKLNAANNADKLRLDAHISQLEAVRDFRLATAGNWEMRLLVILAGVPATVHFGLVAFVSAFPSVGWTVHALPPPMSDYQGAIILSLFGLSAAKLVAGAFRR